MAKTTDIIVKQIFVIAISKKGKAFDDDVQACGIDVLEHFKEHQDVTLINRLYLAMPRGSNHAALAAWLLAHAAVNANHNKDTKHENPFVFAKGKETDVEGAKITPWYNYKPSPTPDLVFDLQAAVKAILHKASKAEGGMRGTQEQLVALAEIANIPASDVPRVKIATREIVRDALDALNNGAIGE